MLIDVIGKIPENMRGWVLSTSSLGQFYNLLTHISNKLYIFKKKPEDLRLTSLVPVKVN